MSFKVTRNFDGSITTESDGRNNFTDHANAQGHCHTLEYMMEKSGLDTIEGRNYNDVADEIAEANVKRWGGDLASEKAYVGLKLGW